MPLVQSKIKGNKKSSWHDFELSTTDMSLNISAGSYWQGGQERYAIETETSITFNTNAVDTIYEVFVEDGGMATITAESPDTRDFGALNSPLMRLAWFTVPAAATTLDNVDIHVVEVVE